MKHHSSYPGTLVLPSGARIAPGAEVDLTEDEAKNEAVKGWISSGWLVKGKAVTNEGGEDVDALKAEIERLTAANGQLQAKVTELEAQVEALTAPPPESAASGYAVAEKSPGWFVVTRDGAEVTKALRKDALAGFEAMTDDEKAAFVQANPSA